MRTAAPVEWPSAKIGGGQSGSTNLAHEGLEIAVVFGKIAHIALAPVAERAIRQALPAPVERRDGKAPRAQSRTVSKYFSIHSARPWKMHTVPRRPAGGSQRAKRKLTPSGVLSMPVTKLSGTGLAGIETSFMRPKLSGCGFAYSSLARSVILL